MFYVSSIMGNKVGVTDTTDRVEEFYTQDNLACFLAKGIVILGASFKNNSSGSLSINVICPEAAKLLYLQKGMPVRLKLSDNLPFKQFLILRADTEGVMLFDGTMSKLTFSFIRTNRVLVDTVSNDAIRVAELLKLVKAGA